MNAALTPNPAEYTSVIVANSTLTQLMNDDLVRPLNDLVQKYGSNLPDNLMITVDGNVMAVAFMANSQHLFSRKDILEKAGIKSIPSTYNQVIDALKLFAKQHNEISNCDEYEDRMECWRIF